MKKFHSLQGSTDGYTLGEAWKDSEKKINATDRIMGKS